MRLGQSRHSMYVRLVERLSYARASLVILSIKITTSRLSSTKRIARSILIQKLEYGFAAADQM